MFHVKQSVNKIWLCQAQPIGFHFLRFFAVFRVLAPSSQRRLTQRPPEQIPVVRIQRRLDARRRHGRGQDGGAENRRRVFFHQSRNR